MNETTANADDCAKYAALLDQATVYGFQFMDDPKPSSPESLIEKVRHTIALDSPPRWPFEVVDFTTQCIQALLGTAALHLHGISRLVATGPVIFLHPLAALVRSVGEACGSLFWHIEPLIDRTDSSDNDFAEFVRRADEVMLRAELRHVTELHSCRRRLGAAHGEDSQKWADADTALDAKKTYLRGRFDAVDTDGEPLTKLNGSAAHWALNNVRIPSYSDLLHHAVEYGHGQGFDGKVDQTIYNLLSGFSHPSIELFYSHVPRDGPATASGLWLLPSVSLAGSVSDENDGDPGSGGRGRRWKKGCDRHPVLATSPAPILDSAAVS